MDLNRPPLWLLTGASGSGKTRVCRALADSLRARGQDVAGLLSPPVLFAGEKTGILAEDLRSGERRVLGVRKGGENIPRHAIREAIPVGGWLFDPQTLAWGNRGIAAAPPCDFLIVDELGPLEFHRGIGLTAAFAALEGGQYRAALAVIRPNLVSLARSRWTWGIVLPVDGFPLDAFLGHQDLW